MTKPEVSFTITAIHAHLMVIKISAVATVTDSHLQGPGALKNAIWFNAKFAKDLKSCIKELRIHEGR